MSRVIMFCFIVVSVFVGSVFTAVPTNGVIEKSSINKTRAGDQYELRIPIDVYQLGGAPDFFKSNDKFVAWIKVRNGKKWKSFSVKAKMTDNKLYFVIKIPTSYSGKTIRLNVFTSTPPIRHNHVNNGGSDNAIVNGKRIPADPNAYIDGDETGYQFTLN